MHFSIHPINARTDFFPSILLISSKKELNRISTTLKAKPFLKWAGGKSQLLETIDSWFPPELKAGKIKTYIEPFVGSGAVFLHVAQAYPVENFYILDINQELTLAYKVIQNSVEELIQKLLAIQEKYLSLDQEERKDYYYQVRSQFNSTTDHNDAVTRTAQLIFLNRTCFNGLFRVNSQGDFNVPMGKYKNPRICNADNLRAIARILQRTQIVRGDFDQCQKWADAQTFVYFDPPYRPISKTANFNTYSSQVFDDSEQLRLRNLFRLLDRQQVKLMLSNSDPKNQDLTDSFFDIAYKDYLIQRVKADRRINSNPQKRGQIDELLITNYRHSI